MKSSLRNSAKALLVAGVLVAMIMPPVISTANAEGVKCVVNVDPGQVCTTTVSCFFGVCTCITVCCCG